MTLRCFKGLLLVRPCVLLTLLWWIAVYMSLESDALTPDGQNDSKKAEEVFRKLYQIERAEQIAAVKALLKIDKYNKQEKVVGAIVEKVFSVLKKSKDILENAGFIPGDSEFPTNERLQDALSNVLENTAFLGDIILRLPDVTQTFLLNNTEWSDMLRWSLKFTNQSQLVDSKTNTLVYLVNQEMNYTARQGNFINPYKKTAQSHLAEEISKPKQKKRKALPRGPRLSSAQWGDL